MYKIGEFSKLTKVTVKALRYYEKEGLLCPAYVDQESGYRFYETKQVIELQRIMVMRQVGFSLNEIRSVLSMNDYGDFLLKKKKELETNLSTLTNQLTRLETMLKEEKRMFEVRIKELPEHIVFYKEGMIRGYNEIGTFIVSIGEEIGKANPGLKFVEPDYCYVEYLDGEFKEKDIHIRYSEAVLKEGKETDSIKFKTVPAVEAASIYMNGSYNQFRKAYRFMLQWIEENGYELAGLMRERYIDGMWNKEKEEDWLTEIQAPIRKK